MNDLFTRMSLISGLESVDFVISFDSETPYEIYKSLLPDILVKGGDYNEEDIVGRDDIKKAGGKVVLIPFLSGYSTSNVINKIINSRVSSDSL